MSQLLTSIFSFLNTDVGQSIVKVAGSAVAQAVGGLITLTHHHVAANVAAPTDSAK